MAKVNPRKLSAKKAAKPKKTSGDKTPPSAKLLDDPAFALSGLQLAITGISQKIDKMKGKSALPDIVHTYVQVKDAAEALEEASKRLKAIRESMQYGMVPEAFDAAKSTTLTIDAGYRVTISQLVHASCNNEEKTKITVWHVNDNEHEGFVSKAQAAERAATYDVPTRVWQREYTGKQAAYWWLRLNGMGSLITETINASTLSAAARKQMEDGKDLPETYFKVDIVPNTSVTKVADKKKAA